MSAATISENALKILSERYLTNGESVEGMFRRVANSNEKYYKLLSELRFLPNSPTLFNSGLDNGCTLSACFVFDVADEMFGSPRSIVNTRNKAIAVAKAGGGVGYYFGEIRPKGSLIKSIHRKACGPVTVLKDYHAISHLVTQGGKRDLAQMGILPVWHQDIKDFIHCKDNDPQGLGSFNISVSWPDEWVDKVWKEKDPKAKSLWDEQINSAWSHGCPGMFFYDTVNKFNGNKHIGYINSTNPCLTGNTMVAVADGRGSVSIKQLAEEKEDVPVYCIDDNKRTTIRMMRNPRVTGINKPILKITLDNGESIRVTPNHKIRLRRGNYIEARNLKIGESLSVMTKYIPTESSRQSRGDRYIAISGTHPITEYEHVLIAQWKEGREVLPGENVHHKDGNRLNNVPNNLEILDESENLQNHSAEASNSNASTATNEDIIEAGRLLARSLERRFSKEEWGEVAREKGLPVNFSSWRRKSIGNFPTFSKICAEKEGVIDHKTAQMRVIRKYQKALESGLDAEIIDNKVYICKHCKTCGFNFIVPYGRREWTYCSNSCHNSDRDMTKAINSIKENCRRKQDKVREQQLEVFICLKDKLGRDPEKREWTIECKSRGVGAEISRESSPFRYWHKLVEAAENFNHKIVSIEEDGYEDVYNGTVDDYHNFYIGCWNEGITKKGRSKIVHINNRNCGETPNRDSEPCNLGSISLPRYFNPGNRDVDWNLLEEDVYIATEFLDDILDRNEFPHPDITEAALLTRKLGLGVMGWADLLAMMHIHYDTEAAVELGRKLMKRINDIALHASVNMAQLKGPYKGYSDRTEGPFARNETRTSIAPTGTIAIIAGVFGGIEPHFSLNLERTTKEGFKLEEDWDRFEGFRPKIASEIAPEWHIRHQAAFQEHTNLGCSKTTNLPNSATREDVSKIYKLMHELGCKGGTVFRDGCRSEQVLIKKTTSVFSTGLKKDLPNTRTSRTHKFRVGGVTGFLTVGLFPDGRVGEFFLTYSKIGTSIRGILDAWAISFSVALQHGTPLEELCQHHIGTRFEPCGITDDKDVPICTSVPDYVCRWLLKHFTKEGEVPRGSGFLCPDCGSEAIYQSGCLTCTTPGCGWTRCS